MEKGYPEQQELLIILEKYLNSIFSPRSTIRLDNSPSVEDISHRYVKYSETVKRVSNSAEEETITLKEAASGKEQSREGQLKRELGAFCRDHLSPFTRGAFLHGSLATGDFTGFSDVDAGLIIRDSVVVSPGLLDECRAAIKKALRIMLRFDPLQHHGFFIIPEGFLSSYPMDYLPGEVLSTAVALGGDFTIGLKEDERPSVVRLKFVELGKTILHKCSNPPHDLHSLKLFLSQIMLMPTLYLQVKGTYVYKKHSFALVREDFPDDWWVMEEITDIREEWSPPGSKMFNFLLGSLPNPWAASYLYKKIGWSISPGLKINMNERLFGGIRSLTESMMKVQDEIG